MPSPAASAGPAVVVEDLEMRYGDKVAVDRLSLTVARGSITAVLGKASQFRIELQQRHRRRQRIGRLAAASYHLAVSRWSWTPCGAVCARVCRTPGRNS